MMLSFHPEADEEFRAAIDYYESLEPGLGEAFYLEIRAAIERILQLPTAWPTLTGDVHRCFAHRFPYAVLYSIEADGIYIVAVMPLRRDPMYWAERLDES